MHFFAVDEKITETNQGLHSFWMLRLKSCYTNSRSVHQHQRSAILHPRPLFFFTGTRRVVAQKRHGLLKQQGPAIHAHAAMPKVAPSSLG